MRTEDAFAYCRRVTRRRARNFWYGIRLLPGPKRDALAAVYAMSRRIDDAGDEDLPLEEKWRRLDDIEASLAGIEQRSPSTDPVVTALRTVVGRFPLPLPAFADLIAGVRMDIEGAEYGTFGQLVVYCRRVAGSVGRLSLAVFRADGTVGLDGLADDLGVGMQLTNILRDVREDLGRGRLYLPMEDVERFGLRRDDLAGPPTDFIVDLIRFQADRARGWLGRGMALLGHLDRRSAACAGAMAGIYRRLLDRIEADPAAALRRRVSLPAWEKAWVGVRALAGIPPTGEPRRAQPPPAREAAA